MVLLPIQPTSIPLFQNVWLEKLTQFMLISCQLAVYLLAWLSVCHKNHLELCTSILLRLYL